MGARGPQPGFKQRRAEVMAVASAEQPKAVAAEPANPFQRARNIHLMPEAELRAYALQVGVSPRDAGGLAVPRLQQNCLLMLHQRIEDLT
jgi:hypothetical protein